MTAIRANGITLEYDEFGERSKPPLLLIMGLGAQMIWWDEQFCRRLAARGYRVIRFDNRDVGRSTKLDDACPDPAPLLAQALSGQRVAPPYTLRDMAADSVGLLDALGIGSAHVVGASMGGMIAQRMAIHFPERVRSLTSIMSTTGNPALPPGDPKVMAVMTSARPTDPAGAIDFAVGIWKALHGPGFPFDQTRVRELVIESAQRSTHLLGQPRQLLAIIADGDRREALRRLQVPTLVIHGDGDPLVPFAGGKDTADNVPGARLVLVAGMGHEVPQGAWPRIIDEIDGHARAAARADARSDSRQSADTAY
jgi:pimeloyl-ACP methyl ester carboxylesterase